MISSTSPSCKALLSAVKKRDYPQVQKLLNEHSLPIDDKWNDYKILIHAVHFGDIKMAKLLLSYGCRVKSTKSHDCKTPLCYAVKSYHEDMVELLLNAGASITDKDSNVDTPLYMAMKNGFTAAVDLMLSKYTVENPLNVTSNDEKVHFYIACVQNNINVVKSFIKCGMNLNTYVDNNADMWPGYSPLHFAVKHQSVQVVELLLSYGADYTWQNADKLSPLHLAFYQEKSENKHRIMDCIIFLHKANPTVNPVDSKGISHFHIACSRYNVDTIVNFLNSGVTVNPPSGPYPLHYAVATGSEKTVEILLKRGANVNIKDDRSSSPLHIALENNLPAIAKMLLAYGANPCIREPYPICLEKHNDYTPIHKAFYNLVNFHEIFSSMMSMHQGKNQNFTDKYGLSIFHMACAVGDTAAVENFLKRNINVNLEVTSGEFGGFTGLHFAAINYHEDVIKLLLKYKANINAVDKKERSAIWLAVQFIISETVFFKLNEKLLKNKVSYEAADVTEQQVMNFMRQEVKKIPVIKLLIENKCNLNCKSVRSLPLLLLKAFKPDVVWQVKGKIPNKHFIQNICEKYNSVCRKEILEILIKNGIEFYSLDEMHNSVLHLLVAENSNSNENLETATILLNNGCKPNVINKDGKTALHIVAKNGSIDFVKLLLTYGANPNCTDMCLSTPLHYAAQESVINDFHVETPHAKIMQLLIDSGAYVDAQDTKGCTPLFATVRQRQSIKALICLLKANCQVNITNSQGISPLLAAGRSKNVYSVKLLLEYGADINLTNSKNSGLLKKMISNFCARDYFDDTYLETFKIIEMHIEKLRLIGYPVSVSDLIYRKHLGIMFAHRIFTNALQVFDEITIRKDANFNLPEENNFITPVLQDELEKMKSCKIDKYTSLYDIFFKNEKQMVKHVKNKIFLECLEQETLITEFQHYGYLLNLKYKLGMERYVLLEPAKDSFRQLIDQDLPELCYDGLFVFLSNADLKNLSDACI